jgi:hypothetical protein
MPNKIQMAISCTSSSPGSAEEQPYVLNQTLKGFAAIPFFGLGSCRHCVVTKHRIGVPVGIWEGAMLYE